MPSQNIIHKVFNLFLSLITVISISIGNTKQVHAQQSAADQVTFSQIYSGTRTLRGPQDTTSMGFRMPAHWSAPTGGQLDLNFNILLFGSGTTTEPVNTLFKAIVQVSLNKVSLGTAIVSNEGDQSVSFPIPLDAWATVNPDGVNDITIQLTTNDQCGGASIMTINSSSVLTIEHGIKLPDTDLRQLPWPFYQNTFYPDTALLVLPDQPSASDLKTALTVSAGFGRLTAGNIQLTTLTASELTNTALQTSNLIFVGKPGDFSQLKSVTWPPKPQDIASDDGLLQMIVSPWNSAKVVLWVSGTNDAGIVKAGEALSSGQIRTGVDTSTAVIVSTHANSLADTSVINTSLSALGYNEEYRQGEGAHSIDYFITLPYSQSANGDGLINLVFANSSLLDFSRSGFSISVNDQFIGSGRFTERSTNVDTLSITIPQAVIVPGQNKITVLETFKFPDACSRPLDSDLWAVVRPETTLHIPIGPAPAGPSALDLRSFPEVFSPTLDTLAFVVSPSDPLGWSVAMDVAYTLGQRTEGTFIAPELAYANDVSEELRASHSLFIIGQPTKLPILSELRDNMPAPFDEGSDVANEPQSELTYRVPSETPNGYLQIFQSAWNQDRLIFALLGNGQPGLLSARDALLTPALRSKLSGNLAVVYGTNIYSSNTLLNLSPDNVTIIVPPTPTPTPTGNTVGGISQSNLVLIGVFAVIIFVFAVIFIVMQRRRTPPKPQ